MATDKRHAAGEPAAKVQKVRKGASDLNDALKSSNSRAQSNPNMSAGAPVPPAPVALLVDLDNVWFGLRGAGIAEATPSALASTLVAVAAQSGPVVIAKAYVSDPRRVPGLLENFKSEGFAIVSVSGTQGGYIDLQIALDCQDLLYTRPDIFTYVLASGDNGFVRLAQSVSARGKSFVVAAPRASSGSLLINHAKTFWPLDELLSKPGRIPPIQPERRPLPPVETAVQHHPRRPALRVFLCHSKFNKKQVRLLYDKLRSELGVQPWLDEKDLVAGQDWELEITRAVKKSHCVIVCLSEAAVGTEGYIHKEITFALDVADRQPEGTIFLIPVRFDECEVPDRLRRYHWVDLFKPTGYGNLTRALSVRANSLEKQ